MKKDKLIHASFDLRRNFQPHVPSEDVRMLGENGTIPRICVAPTIHGCLMGMPLAGEIAWRMQNLGIPIILHAWELSSEKVMDNETVCQYVPDAVETGELWILDTPVIVSEAHYEICNPIFIETPYQKSTYHVLSHRILRRTNKQYNIENLLNVMRNEEERWEAAYKMISAAPLTSVLMSMYEDFKDILKNKEAESS